MNYEHETRVAIQLAVAAGKGIRQAYFNDLKVIIKADGTPVTNADLDANNLIMAGLQEYYPNDGIVSEEAKAIVGKRKWYVDPVDGTRSLAQHNEQFAVHIGFSADDYPTLGVVHKPITGETYVGVQNCGAYKILPSGERRELTTEFKHDGLIAMVQTNWDEYKKHNNLLTRLGVTEVISSSSEGLRVIKLVDRVADCIVPKSVYIPMELFGVVKRC